MRHCNISSVCFNKKKKKKAKFQPWACTVLPQGACPEFENHWFREMQEELM